MILHEWNGYITGLKKNYFVANLMDAETGESFESDIPYRLAGSQDIEMGSIFRLEVDDSDRVNVKFIRHILTQEDVSAGEAWADKIHRAFKDR